MYYLIEEEENSQGICFTMEGQVKGGTLEKLVERLTHHSINGSFFTLFIYFKKKRSKI